MADTISNADLDNLLNDIVSVLNGSATVDIHLFSNNIVFDANTTLAMLVEASYAGYAAQNCVPIGSPSGGSGGVSTAAATHVVFIAGILGSPQDVFGFYVIDGLGALVGGGTFTGGPFNMGGTVPALTVNLSLTLAPG
jgi:hypothetical protein